MLQKVLLLIAFFTVCLLSTESFARQQTDAQQSLLPEIDPQDIEIRSQFQARFPGLRRQPILGFNPRPRVFQVDPGRTPFIEDEEAVMANLPIGELDRPEAPEYDALTYSEPQNGFARVGMGSYITPEADLYGITKLGNNNWVSGNLHYTSTDGHLDEAVSSYRFFDAGINTYSALSENSKLKFYGSASSNYNHFLPVDGFEDSSSRIEKTGFKGGGQLTVNQTSLSGFELELEGFSNQFDIASDFDAYRGEATEWGVNGKAEYSRLGENIQEVHRLRLTTRSGGINPAGGTMDSWSVTELSAHYERLFNYQTEVKAALGVAGATDALNDYTLYITPSLTVNHTLFDGLTVNGLLSGKPGHHTYGNLQEENRFITLSSPLEHYYEFTARAGVQLEPFNGTKITGGVSYQNIKNYLYYSRDELPEPVTPPAPAGYYDVNASNATFMKIHGGFYQDLRPEKLWISADGYLQRPRISGNEKIPFIEALGVKSTVSFRPVKQLLIEGWAEYIGKREDSEENDLSSFVLIGSRFEISITEQAGVFGKVLNLLDENYEKWQGYPERGFQGFVGFTYIF